MQTSFATTLTLLLVLTAVPGAARADPLPDAPPGGPDALGELYDPSACGDVTYEGCCEQSYGIRWCSDGKLAGTHCGKLVPDASCGWNPERGVYDCGYVGVDPSGKHPFACPGSPCQPDCTDRACGTDGCGGSCGTCPEGTLCEWTPGTSGAACVPAPGCGDVPAQGCCTDAGVMACVGGQAVHTYCFRYAAPYDACGWIAAEGRCGCGGTAEAPPDGQLLCPWLTSTSEATVDAQAGFADVATPIPESGTTTDLASADFAALADPATPVEAAMSSDPAATAATSDATTAPGSGAGSACTAGTTAAGSAVALLMLLALTIVSGGMSRIRRRSLDG